MMKVATRMLAALLVASGCDTPPTTPEIVPPVARDSQPAVTPRPLSRLAVVIQRYTDPVMVGDNAAVRVSGFDSQGNHVSTAGAVVTLSDAAVADTSVQVVNAQYAGELMVTETYVYLWYRNPGRLTVTVRLDSVSASADVEVIPPPAATTAIAVDSFAVVEYQLCASGCSYFGYSPVFRLRETTGAGNISVLEITIEFDQDGTLGPCRGEYTLRAGETRELSGLDSYPWNNDMLAVRTDGSRMPRDSATARFLVRDEAGRYGRVEARGTILRLETNPVLPGPPALSWAC